MLAGAPKPEFHKPMPLALYVHLPWCVRKCPYCDFNSHELAEPIPESAYVDALLTDLDAELSAVWGRRLESIFIGGGTPSLFSPEAIDRLLAEVRARFGMRADLEVTLEVNPGTAEQGRFAGYREAGVNRLSIGVQSFEDARLAALGRIHSGEEARAAAAMARAAGFERLNLDLMFGLPGQTEAGAVADVTTAIDLGADHVSHYQLTLEPGTAFGRRPPPLPADTAIIDVQAACAARLKAASFERYEISAWAQRGQAARHNLNYWQFGDYIGIGAGAHGKITDIVAGRVRRRHKAVNPRTYMRAAGTPECLAGETVLAADELPLEFLMNALRLPAGFSRRLFEARTGLPFESIAAPVTALSADGLVADDGEVVAATPEGLEFLNSVLVRLAEALDQPLLEAR